MGACNSKAPSNKNSKKPAKGKGAKKD